jgi:hypothetical protein
MRKVVSVRGLSILLNLVVHTGASLRGYSCVGLEDTAWNVNPQRAMLIKCFATYIKLNNMKTLLASALVFWTTGICAQQIAVRPATQEDFVGYWKLLPYGEDGQPKILKESPWPGKCQFFVHSPKNMWVQVASRDATGKDLEGDRCKKTAQDLDAGISLQDTKSMPSWRYVQGHVQISFPQQNFSEVWKVDVFSNDVAQPNPFGIDIKQGDVIMQLVDLRERRILWRRFLRKID